MRLSIGLGQNRVQRRGKVIIARVTQGLKLSQTPKTGQIFKIWTGNHLLLRQNLNKVSKVGSSIAIKQSGMVERRRQAGKSHVWHTLTRFF